jgi:signal transduction histidine kinase
VTTRSSLAAYRVHMDVKGLDVKGLGRRYGDGVLAGLLAVTMTLELVAWEPPHLSTALGFGLLATAALALRRRTPLVAFIVTMAGIEGLTETAPGFDNDSLTFIIVYFLGLYSLGRHARGHETWLGAIALIVMMGLFVSSEGGLGRADLGDVGFVIVFVGAPWAAGLTLRLRQDREQVLTAEKDAIRAAQAENTRRAVASERATIARELHDVVSHAISVTVLQSRGARAMLGRDEAAVRGALDAIEHTNTQALGDMRRLLAVLRDTEGEGGMSPQPSLARLDTLLDDVRRSGLEVRLDATGEERDVPPGVDLSAYRIVQEALTNVLKHAGTATAVVRLEYGADALQVSVSDDGAGPATNGGPRALEGGHGLIGIRERVAVVGGEVTAGAADGGGFEVIASLPYSVELA